MPRYDSIVSPLGLPLAELILQRPGEVARFAEHQQPGDSPIQTMNHKCAAATTFPADVFIDPVLKRVWFSRFGWHRQQVSGLVDHDQFTIFVTDAETPVCLLLRSPPRRVPPSDLESHLDAVSNRQSVPGIHRQLAIESHTIMVKQPGDMSP
jgi:hypothetical protein